MKSLYLVLVLLFMSGHIIAQNTESTSRVRPEKNSKSKKTDMSLNTNAQKSTTIELKDFPVYQNTGNKEIDDANYAEAKRNWIAANEALYNAYLENLSGSSKSLYELPGFPQYVDTGNPEADKKSFRQAKEDWIKNNKDVYAKYRKSLSAKDSNQVKK